MAVQLLILWVVVTWNEIPVEGNAPESTNILCFWKVQEVINCKASVIRWLLISDVDRLEKDNERVKVTGGKMKMLGDFFSIV